MLLTNNKGMAIMDKREQNILLNEYRYALQNACGLVRFRNEKWWRDLQTNEPIERNVGEMLMLVVSEIAEAMEGDRKKLMDDKLPHRPMIEVELADAMIRLMDIAGGLGLDLAGAWYEKMEYNNTRKDHTREGRLAVGGKAY